MWCIKLCTMNCDHSPGDSIFEFFSNTKFNMEIYIDRLNTLTNIAINNRLYDWTIVVEVDETDTPMRGILRFTLRDVLYRRKLETINSLQWPKEWFN